MVTARKSLTIKFDDTHYVVGAVNASGNITWTPNVSTASALHAVRRFGTFAASGYNATSFTSLTMGGMGFAQGLEQHVMGFNTYNDHASSDAQYKYYASGFGAMRFVMNLSGEVHGFQGAPEGTAGDIVPWTTWFSWSPANGDTLVHTEALAGGSNRTFIGNTEVYINPTAFTAFGTFSVPTNVLGGVSRLYAFGGGSYSGATLGQWSNNAVGPHLILGKTRSTAIGSYAIVQAGDVLGSIRFAATDGTNFDTEGAKISAIVTGSPAGNRVPTYIGVFTSAGAGDDDLAEVFRFGSSGAIGMIAGKKFYPDGLDAGGDTFSWERTPDGWEQQVGGVQALRLDEVAGVVTMTMPTGLTGIVRADAGVVSVAAGVGAKTLFDHFADANNGTTVETDLYADTIPAARLAANGEKVVAQYGLSLVGDATSTQRVKVYFGGTLVFDTGALSIGVTVSTMDLCVTVVRVSSSVVRVVVSSTSSFAALNATAAYVEVTGLTLANTQVLKTTGTAAGVTGGSNQITAKEGFVQWLPAA